MTTQTLIWYTPEEKMPDAKRRVLCDEGSFGYMDYEIGNLRLPDDTIRWAYLDESINLPVMFGVWLSDWCETTGSQDWWNYKDHSYTTEQLFQEFLKTL